MRKIILFIVVLFLPICAKATAWTATTNGTWQTNATWGGSGHPVSGDTATIPTGITVTCNDAETVGTSIAANVAIAITGTGKLALTDGCNLTVQGNVNWDQGASSTCTATSSNATWTWNVPTGQTYTWAWTASGSSPFVFNWSGSSSSANCIMTNVSGAGTALLTNAAHAVNLTLTLLWARFIGMGTGSSTNAGMYFFDSNDSVAPSINHVLFYNDGTIQINLGSKTYGFTWNAIDFRLCADSGYDSGRCLDLIGTGTPIATRLITNLTATHPYLTTFYNMNFNMPGVQIGEDTAYGDSVTVPGYHGYNTPLYFNSTTSTSGIVRASFLVQDIGGNGFADKRNETSG